MVRLGPGGHPGGVTRPLTPEPPVSSSHRDPLPPLALPPGRAILRGGTGAWQPGQGASRRACRLGQPSGHGCQAPWPPARPARTEDRSRARAGAGVRGCGPAPAPGAPKGPEFLAAPAAFVMLTTDSGARPGVVTGRTDLAVGGGRSSPGAEAPTGETRERRARPAACSLSPGRARVWPSAGGDRAPPAEGRSGEVALGSPVGTSASQKRGGPGARGWGAGEAQTHTKGDAAGGGGGGG